MEMNSLGTILLFAVKNGARELHISKNKLPTMINTDGKNSRLCGLNPISATTFGEIVPKYVSQGLQSIKNIGPDEFLIFMVDETIVFRHLPKIGPPSTNNKALSGAYLNKKGLILIVSDSMDLRIKNSYAILSSILNIRELNALVLEQEKYYSLRTYKNSHVISMYRPDLDLDTSLGMSRQINFDCLLIPNCNPDSAIKRAQDISEDKLVIIGIKHNDIHLLNKESILCTINVNSDGTLSGKIDQKVHVNEAIIIKNLKGVKHA